MDVFVKPTLENHQRLKKVHHDFGMFMGEMEDAKNFIDTNKYDVYTFGVSPIQIDIMTACKVIDFDEAYEHSIKMKIDDAIEVNVIHYNQLIQAKNATNRLRDKADVEELKKIRAKKNPESGS